MTSPTEQPEPVYEITESELKAILERRGGLYISCQGKFREEIVERVRSRGFFKQQVGEYCPHLIVDCGCKAECQYQVKGNIRCDYHYFKNIAAIREAAKAEEREIILNSGIALIQKRIDGIFEAYEGETDEKLMARPYAAAQGMDEAIKMLKSLRSGVVQT